MKATSTEPFCVAVPISAHPCDLERLAVVDCLFQSRMYRTASENGAHAWSQYICLHRTVHVSGIALTRSKGPKYSIAQFCLGNYKLSSAQKEC